MARSPGHWNRSLAPEEVPTFLATIPWSARGLPVAEDLLSHFRAIGKADVTQPFGGSLEAAARAVRAEMLIVAATHDILLGPDASRAFAQVAGARFHELEGDCGHQAFVCEHEPLTRDFLEAG